MQKYITKHTNLAYKERQKRIEKRKKEIEKEEGGRNRDQQF